MAKALSCKYCGNNPVPHRLNWYFESVNILFTPLRKALITNGITRFTKIFYHRLHGNTTLLRLFRSIGVVAERADMQKCTVRRAQVLWEEARRRGIVMKELLLFGKPFDTYVAEKFAADHPQEEIVFTGLPRPFGYDNSVLETLDDKLELKRKFLAAGLPVPHGGSVTSWLGARRLFRSLRKPVIVKPRAGSRGRHSTTFIYSEAELRKAFAIAKRLCFWVMVEEHIVGPIYRATVIDYKVCGVLRGDPPQVVGDGQRGIAELVEDKNRQKHPGVQDIQISDQTVEFLRRELGSRRGGMEQASAEEILSYVPSVGETVLLSEKIGVSYGGSSSEDLSICHRDNLALFERAAAILGDPIVGFDFIIPDITKSFTAQACGFIEANSLPFINLHHDPLLGRPQNVAAKVWDMLGW